MLDPRRRRIGGREAEQLDELDMIDLRPVAKVAPLALTDEEKGPDPQKLPTRLSLPGSVTATSPTTMSRLNRVWCSESSES